MIRRIAVFSDIHANTKAFQICRKDAEPWANEFKCLGDLLGYGYDPVGTVEMAMQLFGEKVLVGNHDLGVVLAAEHASDDLRVPSLDPMLPAREPTQLIWGLHRVALQAKPEVWKACQRMFSWERHLQPYVLEGEGWRVSMSHSTFTDFSVYHRAKWKDLHRNIFSHILSGSRSSVTSFSGPPRPGEVMLMLSGHTHVPMLIYSGDDYLHSHPLSFTFNEWSEALSPGMYLINPGSVGQARDGSKRPCYLMIETGGECTRIQYRQPPKYTYDADHEKYDELYESYEDWRPPDAEKRNLIKLAVGILLTGALEDIDKTNWLYGELKRISTEQEIGDQVLNEVVDRLDITLPRMKRWSDELQAVCRDYLKIPWRKIVKEAYDANLAAGDYSSELNQIYESDRSKGYFVREIFEDVKLS